MAEEAAEKHRKAFLQGLKPIGFWSFTPGLKPRPPKERHSPQAAKPWCDEKADVHTDSVVLNFLAGDIEH
jgi:hypothetical protein